MLQMELNMKTLIFFFCVLLIGSSLFGHDLYIRPATFRVSEAKPVQLSMWLAEAFPGEAVDWRADKTADFRVIGPKDSMHPDPKTPVLNLETSGTYIAGWSSTPSYIEIPAADFRVYVKGEGYRGVLEELDRQPGKPGREKYTRFLKTYLQSGAGTTGNFADPFGYKIEIIPLSNPSSLKPGDSLTVQLLFDGKPLAGAAVMATYDTYSTQHEAYAVRTLTDADGKAQIPLIKRGVWMVRANHMLAEKEDPKADWQSFWANISFEVQ